MNIIGGDCPLSTSLPFTNFCVEHRCGIQQRQANVKIHHSIIKTERKGRYRIGISSIHNRGQDIFTNHLSPRRPKDIVMEMR